MKLGYLIIGGIFLAVALVSSIMPYLFEFTRMQIEDNTLIIGASAFIANICFFIGSHKIKWE